MDNYLIEIISRKDYISLSIAAAAVGLAAKYSYNIYSNSRQNYINKDGFKNIPSPPGSYPYIGHMLTLNICPGEQVKRWHEELGPIISLKMGAQPWVCISDQNIAHEIFVRNGVKSVNRPNHDFGYQVYSRGGKGLIFGSTDKAWKNARAAAQIILSPKYVDKFQSALVSTVDTVFKLMREEAEINGSVNPAKYFYMTTYSSILTAVFGKTVQSLDDPNLKDITFFVDHSNKYVTPIGALGSYLPHFEWIYRFTQHKAQMNAIVEVRDKLFTKLLHEAVSGDIDCLAKKLFMLKEEYNLDEMDLIILTGDLIGAGGETSGTSLTWLLAILSNYPEMQKKISDEIDSVIEKEGRIPTFSDRADMPFTTAVLRENIRFRSCTNFGLPHYLEDDVEVFGYLIPKGTTLMTSMHAIHMNPDIYDEPEKFKPERFLNFTKTWSAAANGGIKERDMFAFGWGRRVCPGIYFAEMEIFNMCVRIFSQCTVEPPYGLNGELKSVDMETIYSGGIIAAPLEYKIRFVTRANSLANTLKKSN